MKRIARNFALAPLPLQGGGAYRHPAHPQKGEGKVTGARRRGAHCRGFSIIEVLVVIAIIGILLALGAPAYLQWREGAQANSGVRGAYDVLREARSKALSTNYQYMVQFDQPNRSYRMQKGSQAYNTPASTGWTVVPGRDWATLKNGVAMSSGADCGSQSAVNVIFNADGTAVLESPPATAAPPAGVNVCIQGGTSGKMNIISVSPSGRISLQ